MYGIYANVGGILMVNVTIYSIHGSYGLLSSPGNGKFKLSRDVLDTTGVDVSC